MNKTSEEKIIRKHQQMMQDMASEAARKLADRIDDDLYRKYTKEKKIKMESGKAICLSDCILESCGPINKTLLQFDEGRLYKYITWKYLMGDRVEVQIWNREYKNIKVSDDQYMAEVPGDVFMRHFRPFV